MKRLVLILLGIVLSLLDADAVIENYTKISMIGGMGSIESTIKTEIKGLKKAEDATIKITGGILGTVAGKPQRQVTITRLDKNVIWNVNHNQKNYTESPIDSLNFIPMQEKPKEEKLEYEIVKSEFSVKATGNKKPINSFPCSEYLATWTLELQEIETKEKTQSVMKITLWVTPRSELIKKLEEEENEFNRMFMAKMKTKVSPEEMKRLGSEFITSMFAMKPDDVNKKMINLKEELQKIEGYPIVTEIKWTLAEKSGEKERTAKDWDEMLAQALAKKGEDKSSGTDEAAFYSYSEVKSIKLGEVPDKNFEVPSGYKLVK
ncbi:MAG: hypothetical protein ABIK67_00355 [candidate division WOR-3 bacterium]